MQKDSQLLGKCENHNHVAQELNVLTHLQLKFMFPVNISVSAF